MTPYWLVTSGDTISKQMGCRSLGGGDVMETHEGAWELVRD